ncbi:MAG: hypothetical protein RBG13Loki_0031 [Promethearchaeota archaeon CR_4]|nr:MAG: hypothetical protein RBG13Loki_0031 [Candidatus Lokiarchaeota archaeon CR_4]
MKRGGVILLAGMVAIFCCVLIVPNNVNKQCELGCYAPSTSDAFDPNDIFSNAKPLSTGITYTLTLNSSDINDYFYLYLPSYYTISVNIGWSTGTSDALILFLYDSTETVIWMSYSGSISYTARSAGNYYICVGNYYADSITYTLTATVQFSPFIAGMIAFGIIAAIVNMVIVVVVVRHYRRKVRRIIPKRPALLPQQAPVPTQSLVTVASPKPEIKDNFCRFCGVQLGTSEKFCHNCGTETNL